MWCDHCKRDQHTYRDDDSCSFCCTICGRIAAQDFLTAEPTLVKSPGSQFIKLSGGLPAFEHTEKKSTAKIPVEKINKSNVVYKPQKERTTANFAAEFFKDMKSSARAKKNMVRNQKANLADSKSVRNAIEDRARIGSASDTCDNLKDSNIFHDELDSFSDIDDTEVCGYLNNKEEIHYKKIIWEQMNKEYVKEQATKEAALAVRVKDVSKAPNELRTAQELAVAAAAALAKPRKERRGKRALEEAKNTSPSQTAAEATRQMLTKKRLSSKINYDVLEKLFNDDAEPDSSNNRVESNDD